MKKKITVEFEDAFIEVCLLGEDYPMGYIYAGEIRPKDGTPYHSFESSFVMPMKEAADVIHGAWKCNNLAKYQPKY